MWPRREKHLTLAALSLILGASLLSVTAVPCGPNGRDACAKGEPRGEMSVSFSCLCAGALSKAGSYAHLAHASAYS